MAPYLLRRARRLFPFIECILPTADSGTQDGVAHWCLEVANRQAIGRCWIEALPKRGSSKEHSLDQS